LYTPVDPNAGARGDSGGSLTFIPAEYKQPIDIAVTSARRSAFEREANEYGSYAGW